MTATLTPPSSPARPSRAGWGPPAGHVVVAFGLVIITAMAANVVCGYRHESNPTVVWTVTQGQAGPGPSPPTEQRPQTGSPATQATPGPTSGQADTSPATGSVTADGGVPDVTCASTPYLQTCRKAYAAGAAQFHRDRHDHRGRSAREGNGTDCRLRGR